MKHRILRVDRRLGAAALSGVLYALAQPEWGGWPLAAICLVPMLHAWYGGELGRRVWLAFVFGSIATGLTTIEAGTLGVMSYFGVSVWAAVPIAVAVGLLLGSGSFVLFAALSGDPRRHHAVVWSLRAGAALAASELIRSTLFGGLPWILFAYSLAPVPELAQSASLGGVYLVSFWLTSLNAALALAFNHAQRRGALVTAMLLCAAVYAAQLPSADGQRVPDATGLLPGEGALAEAGSVRPAGVVRIVSVQSGPRDTGQGAAGGSVAAMDRLAQLSRTEHAPDLAIWPENAVGALLPLNEPLIQRSLEKLSSATTHVIVGAPRADPRIPGRFFTSSFLLGPDRRVIAHHDKVRLLPFAEYRPWPFSMLGGSSGATHAGARPNVLEAGSIRFGPMICYEVLFPELARSLVRDGAVILANLSNDAWFGATGAVDQHLAGAVFRAIETRRPLVRSTISGITAAIDARGRVVGRLELNEPGALVVDLRPASRITPYVHTGDLVAWSCLVATSMASLAEALGARRRRRGA